MILFRADGNEKIGTGHIMRCLSIADAFNHLGEETAFVIADDSLKLLIEDRGYKAIVLNSDYQDMMCESERITMIIEKEKPQVIIIDSYFVTAQYMNHLRKYTKTVYIDDIAAFPYPVDVLINYNAYGLNTDYNALYHNKMKKPTMFLGPAYTPLRTMFVNLDKKQQPKNVQNVLISTGGSDSLHIALNLIIYILKLKNIRYRFHFLLGAMNKDKNEIHSLIRKQSNIIIHENVKDMKSLISDMDLVVSAAGSTLYEICACGVPLITYVLADNQISGANAFSDMGLALNLGDLRKEKVYSKEHNIEDALDAHSVKKIIRAIDELANDYSIRCKMGTKMQKMIDGLGVNRIVLELSHLFNH